MLALSFAAPPGWLRTKLVRMVIEATGAVPAVYEGEGQVIICAVRGPHLEAPARLGHFTRVTIAAGEGAAESTPATDNWPFLYLSGKHIPRDYLVVIGILIAISLRLVYAVRGRGLSMNDAHSLFLGMGFLLLETKSIGDCSLYFGATWFVTMIVFAGVLLMVLVANLVSMRLPRFHLLMYAPLLTSLLVVCAAPRETILAWSFGQRVLWTVLAVPLPILFAGLIFSTTLREASAPSAFLGANLIGATIGGFSEYLGMAMGHDGLLLLVLTAYLLSLGCRIRLAVS